MELSGWGRKWRGISSAVRSNGTDPILLFTHTPVSDVRFLTSLDIYFPLEFQGRRSRSSFRGPSWPHILPWQPCVLLNTLFSRLHPPGFLAVAIYCMWNGYLTPCQDFFQRFFAMWTLPMADSVPSITSVHKTSLLFGFHSLAGCWTSRYANKIRLSLRAWSL